MGDIEFEKALNRLGDDAVLSVALRMIDVFSKFYHTQAKEIQALYLENNNKICDMIFNKHQIIANAKREFMVHVDRAITRKHLLTNKQIKMIIKNLNSIGSVHKVDLFPIRLGCSLWAKAR
ncbi:MAG: hypothetical protein FWC61_03310 [Proteobacteria bacterium]|nr:hypothetical protein [Pseudomonadota bacterium]